MKIFEVQETNILSLKFLSCIVAWKLKKILPIHYGWISIREKVIDCHQIHGVGFMHWTLLSIQLHEGM